MPRTLLALLLVLLPGTAAAQAPPPPPPTQEATAELAFVGTTGNASTSTLLLGGEHIARIAPWVLKNRAAFIRNESEDVLTAKSLLYGFRAERTFSTRLAAFGEYGYFRDRFAGVSSRNGIAGGLAFKLVSTTVHQWSVDGALGYLNEQRLTGDDVSSATYGTGSRYRWTISPTATFDDDLALTGTFARGEDWRLVHIASITARLTDLLSLKASHTIRFANDPPPGFKKTDTATAIALVAKFTRN